MKEKKYFIDAVLEKEKQRNENMRLSYEKHNQVPLITINSWNEWTETSYLEPDDKYGYGYLQEIKRVFKE